MASSMFRYNQMVSYLLGLVSGILLSYIVGTTQFSTSDYYRSPLAVVGSSNGASGSSTLYKEHVESVANRTVNLDKGQQLSSEGSRERLPGSGTVESHEESDKHNHEDLGNASRSHEGDEELIEVDPIHFDDGHAHKDDTELADDLYKKVRVLCWVMTSPSNLQKKAIHVRETWAKRCNVFLFVSDEDDKDFPAVGVDVQPGRSHLTAKTMKAFDYVYQHHLDDADWFMKADDDTYVIVENLRYMLSAHDPKDPIYFGHHFQTIVPQGYMSGGGGYVLSKEALVRFGKRRESLCAKDKGAEDVEMGRCLQKLDVRTVDSRDSLGRTRFHCFSPATHLGGGYPKWYYKYDKYGAQKGMGNMSDYAVTFHYVGPKLMYDIEYYVYHLRPYGIRSGYQDLNKPLATGS